MSGAPTPDPFSERQLRAVERIVDQLVAAQLGRRLAAATELHRDLHLAKTVEVSSSYPTSGDTFAIRFLDASFSPQTPGSSTLSTVERTSETDTDDAKDVIAREINGQYIAKGTLVFALFDRGASGSGGEWFIQTAAMLKPKCHFTLDNDLTTSESQESATIQTQYGHGVDHASTSITVKNLPTHTSGVYEFYGDSGDYGIASYSGVGTIWYIDIMECP